MTAMAKMPRDIAIARNGQALGAQHLTPRVPVL